MKIVKVFNSEYFSEENMALNHSQIAGKKGLNLNEPFSQSISKDGEFTVIFKQK